ncbi:unnamed protein product [Pseudo-nitzschia multistriata]|uniref:L domain-like protein n=1 Tax=Pseudo-nitzschia multistriata TaxID=183589 RepID=A0A448Z0W8_9STRA|nr:unnamed protein product [Pseudo-nitzschia multistriata]
MDRFTRMRQKVKQYTNKHTKHRQTVTMASTINSNDTTQTGNQSVESKVDSTNNTDMIYSMESKRQKPVSKNFSVIFGDQFIDEERVEVGSDSRYNQAKLRCEEKIPQDGSNIKDEDVSKLFTNTNNYMAEEDRNECIRKKIKEDIRNASRMSADSLFSLKSSLGKVETYPADCYSVMAIHSPFEKPFFFFFGFMVFCFQVLFLSYMVISQVAPDFTIQGEIDNPSNGIIASFIPSNVTELVRATQFTAILSYCIFADSSLKDCVMAVEYFPRLGRANKEDKVWMAIFSCVLRFISGFLAIFATFLLIITSDDVIDIILNFAAVNYISTLDEAAFELAKYGKYGPQLEIETKSIERRPIPYCIYRKHNHVRYLFTVFPITFCLLLSVGAVIFGQESTHFWVTKTMRVQFKESTGLHKYSGCYGMVKGVNYYKRRNYLGFTENLAPGAIGYCKQHRHWKLFKNEGQSGCDLEGTCDPCDVPRERELAHSSKTETFDVSTVFDALWYSASGTPLDLYFFETENMGKDLEKHCSSFLNDGNCDLFFNTPDYQYDGGDCCASTCDKSNCGTGGITDAFGAQVESGDGYANCRNPRMEPVTIHLNSITSSRNPDLLNVTADQLAEHEREKGTDFWTEEPVTPLMIVNCDGITILSIYVDKKMENSSETIMVEDGARCRISIDNSTGFFKNWDNEAIWWVDYTVYHGNTTTNEIVSAHSYDVDTINFNRVPNCYFDTFENLINLSTAYVSDDHSSYALSWLSNDGSAWCEDGFLIERFALASLNFAAPIINTDSNDVESTDTSPFWIVAEQQQCRWENIACDVGSVETLMIRGKNLDGTIPTTIGLLTGLRRLDYDGDGLKGTIPSELGLLTNLKRLDIDDNVLTGSIPTEFGNFVNMLELDLDKNKLTGSIPTEFGLMMSLTGSIPTEIGNLKNLVMLGVVGNNLTGSIPSEIGKLGKIERLTLANNRIGGTIPNEIQLTKDTMKVLWLSNNVIKGTIPPEIGELTILEELRLDDNRLTGSIPTEIGLMMSLTVLDLAENDLDGTIPTELGLLTNLRELLLEGNSFTGDIPFSVLSLEKLHTLTFDQNSLGGSVPGDIQTTAPCMLCRGISYELIPERNNDAELPGAFACRTLLQDKWDGRPLSARDCATLKNVCVRCTLGGDYTDGDGARQIAPTLRRT